MPFHVGSTPSGAVLLGALLLLRMVLQLIMASKALLSVPSSIPACCHGWTPKLFAVQNKQSFPAYRKSALQVQHLLLSN